MEELAVFDVVNQICAGLQLGLRGVYLEIRHVMAESGALLLYVRRLKTQVQTQVMMQNPFTLEDTIRIADSADSTIWFAN